MGGKRDKVRTYQEEEERAGGQGHADKIDHAERMSWYEERGLVKFFVFGWC
jgi:hypothetical protein